MPTKHEDRVDRAYVSLSLHGALTRLAYLELTDKLTTAEMRQAQACLQTIIKKHKPKHGTKYAA